MACELETVVVDPATAARWLAEKNTKNRNITLARVDGYARIMIAGQWRADTGEPILFAQNGTLIDGQHRLAAVVKADRPVSMLVLRGCANDSFEIIGQARPRSGRDVFSINGEKNTHLLASTTRLVSLYLSGLLSATGRGSRVSNESLLQTLRKNPDIRTSVDYYITTPAHDTHLIPSSIAAFLHWKISKLSKDTANSFVRIAALGTQDTESIMFALHRRLLESSTSRTRKLTANAVLALCIKAANIFCTGQEKKIKILKWSEGEEFPDFVF